MTRTTLQDDVVLLRPYSVDDIEPLYEAARESLVEVGRWLPWCHSQYGRAEAEAWVLGRAKAWSAGQEYSFVIAKLDSGEFLGGCGLNQLEPLARRANLGYWVRTSATGNGYATRAARLLARWGAVHLGLERMEIVAAVGNTGSQRVALKAGATREGVARCRLRANDVQHDAVVFSIIRKDIVQ